MKTRGVCYTLNNYTEEQFQALKQLNCVYHCLAKEIAPTTGTPHIQGYIFFKNPRGIPAIAKELFKAHCESPKGSPQQNRNYIFGPYEGPDGKSKPENPEALEFGTIPCQGKRTDIMAVREAIAAGDGMRGVVAIATNLQQIKLGEAIMKYEEPKKNWKPHVSWYYGTTGTGKSRTAHEELGEGLYRKTGLSGKWWEGYDAHENVLIDDMNPQQFDYKALLDLLDWYGTRVECKGGTRQFLAKRIIITASISPQQMFESYDQNGAELLRRIEVVRQFV